jgi:hypothetical protein
MSFTRRHYLRLPLTFTCDWPGNQRQVMPGF